MVIEDRISRADVWQHDAFELPRLLGIPVASPLEIERTIFLDIETTGLNPGAGTLVIVVGLGYATSNDVEVRQYFLHDPAIEIELLKSIAELLGRFDCIVTFNGKRFDVPMLTGRFLLHRVADPFPPQHLDLLSSSQRIWRRRLGRTNLATLEAQVLGIVRETDVPGYEIPSRYFSYLHDKAHDAIEPVLDHNRRDVLSMIKLAGTIQRLLLEGRNANETYPDDLIGLGRLLEAHGDWRRSIECYEAALFTASPTERAEILLRLADRARKSNELDRAIQLYEAVVTYASAAGSAAAIELAKIYEHQLRQPARALQYARHAQDVLRIRGGNKASSRVPDVTRRIQRLESKTRLSKIVVPSRIS